MKAIEFGIRILSAHGQLVNTWLDSIGYEKPIPDGWVMERDCTAIARRTYEQAMLEAAKCRERSPFGKFEVEPLP